MLVLSFLALILASCDASNSDQITSDRQEASLMNATSKIGMPSITNFRELRMVNKILEDRDKTTITFTYIFNEYKGCFVYIGPSIAYPVPYATQRTSPQKVQKTSVDRFVMPQADPNGLFSPASAEGTFLEMGVPGKANETGVIYSEPRLFTSPFELPNRLICPPIENPASKAEKVVGPKAPIKKEPAD
jgi:hypothetical protein